MFCLLEINTARKFRSLLWANFEFCMESCQIGQALSKEITPLDSSKQEHNKCIASLYNNNIIMKQNPNATFVDHNNRLNGNTYFNEDSFIGEHFKN